MAQWDPPTALTAGSVSRRGSRYAVVLRQVKQAGLLDRRTSYYLWRIAVITALLAGGWLAFVLAGDWWWQLAVAAFLAIVFTQVGFPAHDAGHKQIFGCGRATDTAGIVLANLAVGLGYRFWVDNHNRHHAHPNADGKDPDSTSEPWRSPRTGRRSRPARPPGLPLPGLLLPAITPDRAATHSAHVPDSRDQRPNLRRQQCVSERSSSSSG